MSGRVTSLSFQPPEVAEDQARAGYYALLARLFYAGPDAGLLSSIAAAEAAVQGAEQSALAGAWRSLALAARGTDAESAQREYDQLFIGTGKAEVTPYATFYLAETGREKLLLGLRGDLAEFGLKRRERASEPEDHISGLFDAMRHLIALGNDDAALQNQRAFFDRYIARCYQGLCAAISASEKSNFYKHVAHFAEAFLVVDSEALKVF
ncbi:MAG TPA: molecular chaperone TorD family protein [Burkholderiales bacterium]|nr:molecular chaperone TorD family protein [Burkholderiales bacterium]